MTMRIPKTSLALAVACLLFPSMGWACDTAYQSSAELYETASVIFVGKVLESPWKANADAATRSVITDVVIEAVITRQGTIDPTVRFSVERRFRGVDSNELIIPSLLNSTCSFRFLEGETYLVHGSKTNGVVIAALGHRPLLLRDAGEALKYIEQAMAGQKPGVLVGSFWDGAEGKTQATVHLEGAAGKFQTSTKPASGSGGSCSPAREFCYFEIVGPAGDYIMWFDVEGIPVGERKSVRLVQGQTVLQHFRR